MQQERIESVETDRVARDVDGRAAQLDQVVQICRSIHEEQLTILRLLLCAASLRREIPQPSLNLPWWTQ
jgi:hypothetical protein